MAIPMILVAILFETVVHHVKHKLEHSYVFGQQTLSAEEKQAMRNAAVFGKPLKLSFLTRMGGEFMVLGFLAVFVWFLNRISLFDEIANACVANYDGSFNLPQTGGDFLHLAESVHMILFIAMAFYFGFTFAVLERGLKKTAMFESMRAAMIEKLKATKAGQHLPPNPQLDYFTILRGHFMNHGLHGILEWREKKPDAFAQIVQSMGLDVQSAATISLPELRTSFQGCFSFATFLAFAIREKFEEIIEVSKATWFVIIIIQTIMAILHALEVRLKFLALFFLGMTMVVILIFTAKTWAMRRHIVTHYNTDCVTTESKYSKYWATVNTNMELLMNWAQTLIFFNSYVSAYVLVDMVQDSGEVGDNYFFSTETERVILITAMALSVVLQLVILPESLTNFAYLTALPPFFTERDLHLVLHILKAGGATGAAWGAAYVDEKNAKMVAAASKAGKSEKNISARPQPNQSLLRSLTETAGLERLERGKKDSKPVLVLGKKDADLNDRRDLIPETGVSSVLPVQTSLYKDIASE